VWYFSIPYEKLDYSAHHQLIKKIGGSPKFAVRGQIASSGNNYSLFEKLFKNMVGYLGSM